MGDYRYSGIPGTPPDESEEDEYLPPYNGTSHHMTSLEPSRYTTSRHDSMTSPAGTSSSRMTSRTLEEIYLSLMEVETDEDDWDWSRLAVVYRAPDWRRYQARTPLHRPRLVMERKDGSFKRRYASFLKRTKRPKPAKPSASCDTGLNRAEADDDVTRDVTRGGCFLPCLSLPGDALCSRGGPRLKPRSAPDVRDPNYYDSQPRDWKSRLRSTWSIRSTESSRSRSRGSSPKINEEEPKKYNVGDGIGKILEFAERITAHVNHLNEDHEIPPLSSSWDSRPQSMYGPSRSSSLRERHRSGPQVSFGMEKGDDGDKFYSRSGCYSADIVKSESSEQVKSRKSSGYHSPSRSPQPGRRSCSSPNLGQGSGSDINSPNVSPIRRGVYHSPTTSPTHRIRIPIKYDEIHRLDELKDVIRDPGYDFIHRLRNDDVIIDRSDSGHVIIVVAEDKFKDGGRWCCCCNSDRASAENRLAERRKSMEESPRRRYPESPAGRRYSESPPKRRDDTAKSKTGAMVSSSTAPALSAKYSAKRVVLRTRSAIEPEHIRATHERVKSESPNRRESPSIHRSAKKSQSDYAMAMRTSPVRQCKSVDFSSFTSDSDRRRRPVELDLATVDKLDESVHVSRSSPMLDQWDENSSLQSASYHDDKSSNLSYPSPMRTRTSIASPGQDSGIVSSMTDSYDVLASSSRQSQVTSRDDVSARANLGDSAVTSMDLESWMRLYNQDSNMGQVTSLIQQMTDDLGDDQARALPQVHRSCLSARSTSELNKSESHRKKESRDLAALDLSRERDSNQRRPARGLEFRLGFSTGGRAYSASSFFFPERGQFLNKFNVVSETELGPTESAQSQVRTRQERPEIVRIREDSERLEDSESSGSSGESQVLVQTPPAGAPTIVQRVETTLASPSTPAPSAQHSQIGPVDPSVAEKPDTSQKQTVINQESVKEKAKATVKAEIEKAKAEIQKERLLGKKKAESSELPAARTERSYEVRNGARAKTKSPGESAPVHGALSQVRSAPATELRGAKAARLVLHSKSVSLDSSKPGARQTRVSDSEIGPSPMKTSDEIQKRVLPLKPSEDSKSKERRDRMPSPVGPTMRAPSDHAPEEVKSPSSSMQQPSPVLQLRAQATTQPEVSSSSSSIQSPPTTVSSRSAPVQAPVSPKPALSVKTTAASTAQSSPSNSCASSPKSPRERKSSVERDRITIPAQTIVQHAPSSERTEDFQIFEPMRFDSPDISPSKPLASPVSKTAESPGLSRRLQFGVFRLRDEGSRSPSADSTAHGERVSPGERDDSWTAVAPSPPVTMTSPVSMTSERSIMTSVTGPGVRTLDVSPSRILMEPRVDDRQMTEATSTVENGTETSKSKPSELSESRKPKAALRLSREMKRQSPVRELSTPAHAERTMEKSQPSEEGTVLSLTGTELTISSPTTSEDSSSPEMETAPQEVDGAGMKPESNNGGQNFTQELQLPEIPLRLAPSPALTSSTSTSADSSPELPQVDSDFASPPPDMDNIVSEGVADDLRDATADDVSPRDVIKPLPIETSENDEPKPEILSPHVVEPEPPITDSDSSETELCDSTEASDFESESDHEIESPEADSPPQKTETPTNVVESPVRVETHLKSETPTNAETPDRVESSPQAMETETKEKEKSSPEDEASDPLNRGKAALLKLIGRPRSHSTGDSSTSIFDVIGRARSRSTERVAETEKEGETDGTSSPSRIMRFIRQRTRSLSRERRRSETEPEVVAQETETETPPPMSTAIGAAIFDRFAKRMEEATRSLQSLRTTPDRETDDELEIANLDQADGIPENLAAKTDENVVENGESISSAEESKPRDKPPLVLQYSLDEEDDSVCEDLKNVPKFTRGRLIGHRDSSSSSSSSSSSQSSTDSQVTVINRFRGKNSIPASPSDEDIKLVDAKVSPIDHGGEGRRFSAEVKFVTEKTEAVEHEKSKIPNEESSGTETNENVSVQVVKESMPRSESMERDVQTAKEISKFSQELHRMSLKIDSEIDEVDSKLYSDRKTSLESGRTREPYENISIRFGGLDQFGVLQSTFTTSSRSAFTPTQSIDREDSESAQKSSSITDSGVSPEKSGDSGTDESMEHQAQFSKSEIKVLPDKSTTPMTRVEAVPKPMKSHSSVETISTPDTTDQSGYTADTSPSTSSPDTGVSGSPRDSQIPFLIEKSRSDPSSPQIQKRLEFQNKSIMTRSDYKQRDKDTKQIHHSFSEPSDLSQDKELDLTHCIAETDVHQALICQDSPRHCFMMNQDKPDFTVLAYPADSNELPEEESEEEREVEEPSIPGSNMDYQSLRSESGFSSQSASMPSSESQSGRSSFSLGEPSLGLALLSEMDFGVGAIPRTSPRRSPYRHPPDDDDVFPLENFQTGTFELSSSPERPRSNSSENVVSQTLSRQYVSQSIQIARTGLVSQAFSRSFIPTGESPTMPRSFSHLGAVAAAESELDEDNLTVFQSMTETEREVFHRETGQQVDSVIGFYDDEEYRLCRGIVDEIFDKAMMIVNSVLFRPLSVEEMMSSERLEYEEMVAAGASEMFDSGQTMAMSEEAKVEKCVKYCKRYGPYAVGTMAFAGLVLFMYKKLR